MAYRFKIEFRKQQLYWENNSDDPIIVQCNADCSATYLHQVIDNNDWLEVTEDVEGIDDLSVEWSSLNDDYTRDSDNVSASQFGSNYSKAVSIQLGFKGVAFKFIYDWLMSASCQVLNAVEVQITDLICGKAYRIFEIKADNIQYSPVVSPCYVKLALREQDKVYHSFQKTIIEDDWQGWFNSDGTSTKDHPAIMYVVEKKPQFVISILLIIAYIAGILGGFVSLFEFYRAWIRRLLGVVYFCPAPLNRTYIENICTKYGYTFDTMFDDLPENDYKDSVLFFPVTRYEKEFNDDVWSGQTKFFWENRTAYAFSDYLNQLKKLFNAEWYVTPNKQLVFKPKAFFDALPAIYDYTAIGSFPLTNLTYSYNGNKKPAYGDYQYKIDPQDTCSNDLKWRYNTIVDFDGPADNPMLEGNRTKQFEFACTSFMYDGATHDFIEEGVTLAEKVAGFTILAGLIALLAMTDFLTAALTAGACTFGFIATNNFIKKFINNANLQGAVRTGSNVVNVPRILLYNPNSPINAGKIQSVTSPPLVPYYNTEGKNYYEEHPAFEAPAGYFGSEVVNIYNYGLYFDEDFSNNLYSRFHEVDNPLKTPETNQDFSAEVDLCCEMLDLFGVWEGDFAKIGAKLTLENRFGRLIEGRLTSLKVDYAKGRIYLKGLVLSCGAQSISQPPECNGSSPVIISVIRNDDNSITITGVGSDLTLIEVYVSDDDTIYTQVSGTWGAANLATGITLTDAQIGSHLFIKIRSYDSTCDYGFSSTAVVPPPFVETAVYIWIGSNLVCLTDEEEQNTGYKTFTTLIEENALTGVPTGNTKPNDPSDLDFIPPVYDATACPLPQTTGTYWSCDPLTSCCEITTIRCTDGSTQVVNSGMMFCTVLIEYDAATGLATGNTKANVPSDPDYIAPKMSEDVCPIFKPSTPTSWVCDSTTSCCELITIECDGVTTQTRSGRKICVTLTEIDNVTGLPTGNTKPNDPADYDYVPPVIDLSVCPIIPVTSDTNFVIDNDSGYALDNDSGRLCHLFDPTIPCGGTSGGGGTGGGTGGDTGGGTGGSGGGTTGLTAMSWTIEGVERTALVYKPLGTNLPVLFAFHGHAGTALGFSRKNFQAYLTGWIVVYPDGLPTTSPADSTGRNTGWQHTVGEVNIHTGITDQDVKFYDQMLITLAPSIDPSKVFIHGWSNGGEFTYDVLWVVRASTIHSMICGSAILNTTSGKAQRPVMHTAGHSDPAVPYAVQASRFEDIKILNDCAATGTTWATGSYGVIAKKYVSTSGHDCIFLEYDGGHSYPTNVPQLIARFCSESI